MGGKNKHLRVYLNDTLQNGVIITNQKQIYTYKFICVRYVINMFLMIKSSILPYPPINYQCSLYCETP